MKRLIGAVSALALLAASTPPKAPPVATEVQSALHAMDQDVRVAGLLEELKTAAVHGLILIRDVQIVDAVAETVTPHQSVIVSGSGIAWVGPVGTEPMLDKPAIVEGAGRFLAPGLTDMHVHTAAADGWLLNLANGVTSVRDMDGFPWLLRMRDSIDARRVLGPVDYVAGTIINAAPLEGYAVMPRTALDVRRVVRQQAACGYDFIKVHNVLPQPLFDAAAEEASRFGMDLVGHVPHDIAVRHAVDAHMRTMEHLKGFLNDRTLKLGDTDYAAVGPDVEVWNTPTLYALRAPLRGAEARSFFDSPQARYVPLRSRQAWTRSADAPQEDSDRLLAETSPIVDGIMARLHAVHARFLAGTDAAGYPFKSWASRWWMNCSCSSIRA